MQATPYRIYPTRSGTRIRQNRMAEVTYGSGPQGAQSTSKF
ncbi:MAG: hypothetical protein AB7D06_08345 [Pedobacter sp.]|jgi:hypothetical protein